MALPQSFMDALRARTTLSAVIGRTLKLDKAGREFKACCPFHGEKTPSFTVNDAKGFAHCFGCGWHGDAIRWLTDHQGLAFIDAVKELAGQAGLDVPAPSPEAASRAAQVQTVRAALDIAQGVFVRQLEQTGAVMEYLASREIGPAEIAAFGIGYARGGDGSLRGSGIGLKLGRAAGLLAERDDGNLREMFFDRITVPIHDQRGLLVGFGARVHPLRRGDTPKFVNSPDGELFDKGRTLFNLHRAAAPSRPSAENRLLVVEGYFDVIALARAGIHAAVAPMGTALTAAQLERCWRLHHRPVLLLDGDAAGRKAAVRACRTALPLLGPGRELAAALLPAGKDPDDLLRNDAGGAGLRAIETALLEAAPLYRLLFDDVVAGAGQSPEARAGIWAELAELAGQIGDEDTRSEYLGVWRARFEREVSALPQLAEAEPLHAVVRAEDEPARAVDPATGKVPDYAFPESESDSARHLIQIVRRALKLRAERKAIGEELADVMKFAEGIGFLKKEINTVIRDIESDLAKGPAVREEAEMVRVLYRRTLGVRGPMSEAMLPQVIDARPRAASAQIRRRSKIEALIDAR